LVATKLKRLDKSQLETSIAIVWQDRCTVPLCDRLGEQGYAVEISDRSTLPF